jgi:hypothetical protein
MIVKLNIPKEDYEKTFTANKGTYVYKEDVDKFIKDNTHEEALQATRRNAPT